MHTTNFVAKIEWSYDSDKKHTQCDKQQYQYTI